jgi:hypothetical protein
LQKNQQIGYQNKNYDEDKSNLQHADNFVIAIDSTIGVIVTNREVNGLDINGMSNEDI